MEKRLAEAALTGSVDSLRKLIDEDPLILDRIIVSCISETPLHIAATLNHLFFVSELLRLKPEFATEFDSFGSAPLHLAAAKGHLEVVRKLLSANQGMCLVRNQEGRSPLHLAAMKGRVEVLDELLRVKPEAIRLLTDRGETALHLCVKYNRFEAFAILLEFTAKFDDAILNLRDCDGHTVLHIAVARKQIETIKLLLTTVGVEVNALSSNGSTALDILTQSLRDLRDMEIEDILRNAGAFCSKDIFPIAQEWVPTKIPQIPKALTLASQKSIPKEEPNTKHKHTTDWLGRKRSSLMVVASLIATVAFQAGLAPPGGVWQDNYKEDDVGNPVPDPHTAGEAVMAYTAAAEYGIFMIFNTIAFLASLSIILLLVSGLPIKRRRWLWIQMVTMWIAISAQVATYFLSLRNLSPNKKGGMLRKVTEVSVLIWFGIMGVVFIGNIVRVFLAAREKLEFRKGKPLVPSSSLVDEDHGEEI